jgi:hypothetical protein
VIFRRLKSLPETLKSVMTICAQFPKLDVASPNPVSRSIFSETYEPFENPRRFLVIPSTPLSTNCSD